MAGSPEEFFLSFNKFINNFKNAKADIDLKRTMAERSQNKQAKLRKS